MVHRLWPHTRSRSGSSPLDETPCKVRLRENSLAQFDQRCPNSPLVEALSPVADDGAQGPAHRRQAHVGIQVEWAVGTQLLRPRDFVDQVAGQRSTSAEATKPSSASSMAGAEDCGEGEASAAIMEGQPSVDGAWNRDGAQVAADRHDPVPLGSELVGVDTSAGRPMADRATGWPPGGQIIASMSPPIPHRYGLVTAMTAAVPDGCVGCRARLVGQTGQTPAVDGEMVRPHSPCRVGRSWERTEPGSTPLASHSTRRQAQSGWSALPVSRPTGSAGRGDYDERPPESPPRRRPSPSPSRGVARCPHRSSSARAGRNASPRLVNR